MGFCLQDRGHAFWGVSLRLHPDGSPPVQVGLDAVGDLAHGAPRGCGVGACLAGHPPGDPLRGVLEPPADQYLLALEELRQGGERSVVQARAQQAELGAVDVGEVEQCADEGPRVGQGARAQLPQGLRHRLAQRERPSVLVS